jgi:chromosome segregation ATPase
MEIQYTDMGTRDLRTALKTLSDQSLKTSRRLDDTYYSILEKVSVLRQTIGSLQELSGLTKELHENFESDTKELLDDVQGQFDGFDHFENQQQELVDLEDRIQVGKKKADCLTERLAKAKERVDARAQAELEWSEKHTRMAPQASTCNLYTDIAL